MLTFILKLAGIIGASIVAGILASHETVDGGMRDTHPYAAVIVELTAFAIIL